MKTLLIYNPNAGKKRKIVQNNEPITLELLKEIFEQYQIPIDFAPTKHPGHATELAQKAVKNNYSLVIAAGGDGTISETASGLINTNTTLGIIPMGSFMNIARMLSIPNDLEKAVQLIKISRTRKIDVGSLQELGGKVLHKPFYFLEGAGLGLEAQIQKYVLELERGKLSASFKLIKIFFDYYYNKATVTIDNKEIKSRAILISISNGPVTGASLEMAPGAKLNDHKLTVTFYNMTKFELLRHMLYLKGFGNFKSKHLEVHQGKIVKIDLKIKRLVHADARLFGETPIECTIIPNALTVITGFPKKGESALQKRTYLDS